MDDDAVLETLTDRVAGELRNAILTHKLKPDAPIRQAKLAEEFGTSRIPVREALRRLESEGLVIIRPNSGARVVVLDYDGCVEIYKMRERLEPLALSESMSNLTEEQLAAITEFGHRPMEVPENMGAWLEEDRNFHLATYAGTTPRLRKTIETFWSTTQHYRRLLLTTWTAEDFTMNSHEHGLLANAVVEGNTRAGEDILRLHLERARFRLARHAALFDRE